MEGIDDSILGADDDELDYDLEQDEEEALLADPDNFDESEENQDESALGTQYEEPEQNEDVLDIDASVRLDEVEEETQDNSAKNSANVLDDDDDETKNQKERNRFSSERVPTQNVNRPMSSVIPDSLDKVNVNAQHVPTNKNTMQRNNGRYQRGRGGRGRQNFHRGSVFDRVGHNQVEGPSTVHINRHFRGKIQANDNSRLVWDQPPTNAMNPPRFNPGPQLAQVAPFQAQPHPWINQPLPEQSHNAFNQPPIHQQSFQEAQPPMHFNQPQEVMNQGIRPLLNNPPPPLFSQPPQMGQNSAGFRGREVRYNQHQHNNQTVAMNPPNTYHQQGGAPFPGRNDFNQRQPFVNQQIPQQNVQHSPFLPPNHNQPFEPPSPQPFINPNPYPLNQPHFHNQNFPPPIQTFPPQQNFNQPQAFESYEAQTNQFNAPNQYQPQRSQFQITVPNNVANNIHPEPYPNQSNQPDNFHQNQNFNNATQPQQYNNNNRNQFNNRGHHNSMRQNRHNYNPNNRSPPKRRPFENKTLAGGNDRDLPKKKKRSMELSNLHEVLTVDMPDTTTEDKVEEEEDEETKEYRKQIEAQKQLREKMLREKEQRRKLAAAQNVQDNSSGPTEETSSVTQTKRNLTTIPTIKAPVKKVIQVVQNKIPQVGVAQKRIQQNQQPLLMQKQQFQQHQQQQVQRRIQQQRRPIHQQQQQQQQGQVKRIISNNQQQSNNTSMIQRRVNNQTQPVFLITQKNNQQVQKQVPQQPHRIVMMKQQQQQQQHQQQNNQTHTAALNRIVVLKGLNNATVVENDITDSANAEKRPFLSNRKVIANNVDNKVNLNQGLIDSPVVVVSNLAAGTTDIKIRKLCQGLGPVQTIQMISNNRQATIRFKNIVSAHKFFKKYQRKIVDLSMIQVTLGEPS